MGDTATSLLCDTMQVHERCTGAHQFFLWPPDLPKPVQIKGIGTICQITDNGCFSAALVPAKNGEQSYPNYLLRPTEQGVRKAQCWEQQHSNTFVSHRAPSPHWRPTAVSALPRTQSFLIHLSGTQIYLLSDQRMFLFKPTKPGRKGLSEGVTFSITTSSDCRAIPASQLTAGLLWLRMEAPGKSGRTLALMLGPYKEAACMPQCLPGTFPARKAKPLGNHLFSSCCPSAWEADWQLKGEGLEVVLIVWGLCSNMDGERGGPHGRRKNGNLCEAWHSKCHLCEDLDLLRSVFNNLGCSGLFPLSPLPPLFLPYEQALFQSGSKPFSVA